MSKAKKFVHVVNFWLKSDLTPEQQEIFLQELKNLEKIETITYFHVGTPATTNRPVIDRSYSYCLLTIFDTEEGHQVYQDHPVHRSFVNTCKDYWDRVLIYDSISI